MSEPVTIADMLYECRRELALRRSVYPKQVAMQRITKVQAERQMARLTAIHDLLTKLSLQQPIADIPLGEPIWPVRERLI